MSLKKALGLDDANMAKLIGVSPQSYKKAKDKAKKVSKKVAKKTGEEAEKGFLKMWNRGIKWD